MATEEQIQKLKDSWIHDPCWDIEDTEGFEEHHDELLAWRLDLEEKHRLAANARAELRLEKIKKGTGVTDAEIAKSLYTWEELENDVFRGKEKQSQIRALLLLAAQVKRVADALEEANMNMSGTDHQDFMTRLYKVD
jgi:hypothetical protein